MIQIPQNFVHMNDYDKVVNDVLTQLNTGKDKHGEGAIGTAYIDWGITGDFYQNCPSKSVADTVARAFKDKGYYVYVQRMGTAIDASLKALPSVIESTKKRVSTIIGMNYDTRTRSDGNKPFT